MSRTLEQVENKDGNTVKIMRDRVPVNPLRENDIVKLALKHSRHDLGHDLDLTDHANSLEELRSMIKDRHDVAFIAKVYLYDHSGLRIKIGPFNGLARGHARFDSGPVGYAFITEEAARDDWSDERLRDVAEDMVGVYDQYLRGDVCRYKEVTNDDGDEGLVDSCGGFYDIENLKDYAGIADDTEVKV